MTPIVAMAGTLVPPGLLVLLGFAASVVRRVVVGRREGSEVGGRGASAQAGEELHALLYAGKRVELEQRRIELVLRDDEHDGAPPRAAIDLAAGTARIRAAGGQRNRGTDAASACSGGEAGG